MGFRNLLCGKKTNTMCLCLLHSPRRHIHRSCLTQECMHENYASPRTPGLRPAPGSAVNTMQLQSVILTQTKQARQRKRRKPGGATQPKQKKKNNDKEENTSSIWLRAAIGTQKATSPTGRILVSCVRSLPSLVPRHQTSGPERQADNSMGSTDAANIHSQAISSS